jgi:hypothetical protein
MPYLIDGHNLVPKVGLRLDLLDDEMALVAILQDFARSNRCQVEVYFDGAPPGRAVSRTLGRVKAHFIRLGSSADSAIHARLHGLGRAAKNWTVVSSDHEVCKAARSAQAASLSSEEFARLLRQANRGVSTKAGEKIQSNAEVEEWLKVFSTNRGDGE